jgi:hypothetical protein
VDLVPDRQSTIGADEAVTALLAKLNGGIIAGSIGLVGAAPSSIGRTPTGGLTPVAARCHHETSR